MQKGVLAKSDDDEQDEEKEERKEGGDEQDGPEQQSVEPDSDEQDSTMFYPWTPEENLLREVLNYYDPTRVVSLTAGCGQLEMACIRDDLQCVSIVNSETHRKVS
jgi:hypothetical protein